MITATVAAVTGVSSTFWVPNYVTFMPLAQEIKVSILGFLSQAAFTAKDQALDERTYVISGTDYATILSNATSQGVAVAVENWIIANDTTFSSGIVS